MVVVVVVVVFFLFLFFCVVDDGVFLFGVQLLQYLHDTPGAAVFFLLSHVRDECLVFVTPVLPVFFLSPFQALPYAVPCFFCCSFVFFLVVITLA